MIKVSEGRTYDEWLEAMDVFSLEKRRLQEELKYQKSCHIEYKAELFRDMP